MAIRFARLRAARLAQIGGDAAFAKGNQRLDVRAHGAGQANQNFKVRLDAGAISGLFDHLHIAESVGHGAGLLVEAGGGKHNVGQRRGLGEEDDPAR